MTVFGVYADSGSGSGSAQDLDYPPVSFTCPSLPPLAHPARNVHELRPQDIKVVMALGDSITAG